MNSFLTFLDRNLDLELGEHAKYTAAFVRVNDLVFLILRIRPDEGAVLDASSWQMQENHYKPHLIVLWPKEALQRRADDESWRDIDNIIRDLSAVGVQEVSVGPFGAYYNSFVIAENIPRALRAWVFQGVISAEEADPLFKFIEAQMLETSAKGARDRIGAHAAVNADPAATLN
jgi:hypothetical protein